ncbi:hypothetical protein E4U19_007917 [Claviceps sp. Clav32 group G5]|nr:hypothetical protein E4U19_007917 [Claviceps sp. Clav32 group G5]
MTDLIEEERRIILDNPLGHSLHSVREALHDAEGAAKGEAFDAERSDPWLEALSKLVTALYASRACLWLATTIEKRRDLLSNLSDICTRLEKLKFPSQVVRPLSQLVLNQASDIDIWTAVIAVIATLNKDTLHTYQPLLWRTFAYSATEAEAEVFNEICHCTHCAVGGFHQKYFEGHEWNSRAEEVWQRAKRLYSDREKKWLHLHASLLRRTFAASVLSCRTISWQPNELHTLGGSYNMRMVLTPRTMVLTPTAMVLTPGTHRNWSFWSKRRRTDLQ